MVERYSDKGRWGNNRGICKSCDKERELFDVLSMDQDAWFCADCIKKFGIRQLSFAANAALAARTMPKPTPRSTCLRCDTALVPGISVGLMCHQCNGKYREMFGRDVKWQS